MQPHAEFDSRFSDDEATALPWEETSRLLRDAELYWITTVRSDGRPHVAPLIGVWLDDALHFCTGPEEQKAHNLA
ncbi:MAG TPA: pyridoxamine 5'-phosphate oxidase family protein, partial [Actinomycetes bacterium]|nr:pyridoxamine 5'-phosphate oxidase family protein [Actinomycetes bacterium]